MLVLAYLQRSIEKKITEKQTRLVSSVLNGVVKDQILSLHVYLYFALP